MHWADEIAEELIRQYPEQGGFTCASGISPSGPVHVGNLRDIVTIWFVGKALKERGTAVRLFHSWDDYDRFRKVPRGVPASFAEFIGRPLSHVPDPSGRFATYAERFEREFEAALAQMGIEIEFRYQTRLYEGGAYREGIATAVRHRHTVYDIVAGYRTQGGTERERERYFPLTIYCESCDRDTTEIVSADPSAAVFTCRCTGCGRHGAVDLARATNVKLPWKVDWAMRWRHEGVQFEPGGKDHATAGGSYEVSSEISTRVYGYRPPVFQPYEFIGIKGLTGKMSGSTGELLTPADVLDIYQPEVLLWVFARTPPTRAFDLMMDDQVQRIYDEFDRASGGEEGLAADRRSLELARIEGREVHAVPFRQLASFSGVVQGNRGALEGIFARLGTPLREAQFAERLQKAQAWLERCAPQERVALQSAPDRAFFETLSPEEREWVAELCRWLARPGFTLDEATEKLYAIPRAAGAEPGEQKRAQRRFFTIVYRLLFGKETGPRLGTFLAAVAREAYIGLLDFSAS